jgi:hypothetical protein
MLLPWWKRRLNPRCEEAEFVDVQPNPWPLVVRNAGSGRDRRGQLARDRAGEGRAVSLESEASSVFSRYSDVYLNRCIGASPLPLALLLCCTLYVVKLLICSACFPLLSLRSTENYSVSSQSPVDFYAHSILL